MWVVNTFMTASSDVSNSNVTHLAMMTPNINFLCVLSLRPYVRLSQRAAFETAVRSVKLASLSIERCASNMRLWRLPCLQIVFRWSGCNAFDVQVTRRRE